MAPPVCWIFCFCSVAGSRDTSSIFNPVMVSAHSQRSRAGLRVERDQGVSACCLPQGSSNTVVFIQIITLKKTRIRQVEFTSFNCYLGIFHVKKFGNHCRNYQSIPLCKLTMTECLIRSYSNETNNGLLLQHFKVMPSVMLKLSFVSAFMTSEED